jgi:phage terminase large subunit GpA-like protein
MKDLNDQKPIKPPQKSISDFVTDNRIMPSGTPNPGPVDLSITPHVIEWMENASPYSPIQHQVWLKGAQIAATFAIEGIIGYWMKEFPTAIMYMSATQELLSEWASKRLEPMIDSCGVRGKILENAEQQFGAKSRRTGDKTFQKLFVGGFLKMVSAQSAASQRSDSIRLLIRDETEGAPKELTTGEGSWLNTSKARTKFWGARKKIIDLSTPGDAEGNYIENAYKDGDQRLRMIPCPLCGKKQPLYEMPEEGNHGLRADKKAGKIESVYYLCEFCHDAIFEHHKYKMFLKGIWEPTAVSRSEIYRSYYINSLYSPSGTFSWEDYYNDWELSKVGPEEEKGFINLCAGHVYQETGARPKIDSIHHLRGDYREMTIPYGVLFLTASVDVQTGAEKYKTLNRDDLNMEIEAAKKENRLENFPRLEMEILGHGGGYRSWSIGYFRFEGHLNDIDAGAWAQLTDFFKDLATNSDTTSGDYKVPTIKRADGYEFEIPMVFIDAGDGNMKDTVYSYTQNYDSFYPSMGHNPKREVMEKGDKESRSDRRPFKLNKASEDVFYYSISTNYYKKRIYKRATLERLSVGHQRPGFMDHPESYNDNYFKMLFAEDHLKDGTFDARGRRNEALDIKVYNLCCGDAYLDMLVDYWRRIYHGKGYSMERCKNEINTVWVLKYLEDKTKKIN